MLPVLAWFLGTAAKVESSWNLASFWVCGGWVLRWDGMGAGLEREGAGKDVSGACELFNYTYIYIFGRG